MPATPCLSSTHLTLNGTCVHATRADDDDAGAQILLDTSPGSYSSLDGKWSRGKLLLQPARDQRPCKSCVAHAVIAAAEVRWGRLACSSRRTSAQLRHTLCVCMFQRLVRACV